MTQEHSTYRHWARFEGRLLMVGCGCVGQGVLPLILRHIAMDRDHISILSPNPDEAAVAASYGIRFAELGLTPENYAQVLASWLKAGDFLLNLSVDVGSRALIEWCREHGVLYLDACIEPWAGGHFDTRIPPGLRTNYALRHAARGLRNADNSGPTAVLAHGVNPGLVSHFVKQALLDLAADLLPSTPEPRTRAEWAALARALDVRVIHVAERDTQTSPLNKAPGEFVNTWSVEGFAGEGRQPAELGWGSHERHFPPAGHRHDFGSGAAIWLARPGSDTRVRTWTPLEGPFHGFLVTHQESISIAEYLTVEEGGQVRYRPTVHYAYHPCDDAVLSLHELAGKNWVLQDERRQLTAGDIDQGMDELGVLLMGHAHTCYWYGSRLTIDQARALCPLNNATSLQTAAGVLGGVVWAMNHPRAGIVEPDELDFREVLAVALPYLGDMVGVYGDWTPLHDRGRLFPEDLDLDDPWQFKNILVS